MYSIDDLRSNILFKDLNLDSLNFQFDPKNFIEIKEGEIFYKVGTEAHFFYLIINGKVKLKNSVTRKILVKSKNEFFGETEILQDTSRTFSALADSNCVIYKIESEHLKDLVKNSEQIRKLLFNSLENNEAIKSELPSSPLPALELKNDTIKLDIKSANETIPPEPRSEKPLQANNLVDRIISKTIEKEENNNLSKDKSNEFEELVKEGSGNTDQNAYSKIIESEKIEIEESTEYIGGNTKRRSDKIEIVETTSVAHDKSAAEKDKFELNIPEKELDKFKKILQTSSDKITAVKNIFNFLLKITDSEIGAFYLFNSTENKLEETIQTFSSFYKSKRPIKDGITALVAKEKKLRIVDSYENNSSFNPDVDLPNEFKGKTLIFMPLVDIKNNLLALVQVGSEQTEFTKDEIKMFEYAIEYSSYILHNSINYKEPLKKKKEPVDTKLIANFILDDVKIPLMTIRKHASFLTKLNLEDDGKKASSIILAKSIAALELLQSLVEAEEGKTDFIFEIISFRDAINHILSLLAESIDIRKTKLFKKFTEDAIIKIDTHKLFIACYYVVKFASDIMSDEGKLYFSNYIDEDKIILKINDENTSINREIISNLFDDFFYINNEKKTGIGLSIARKLISDMNAQLQIESASRGISYLISFNIISR